MTGFPDLPFARGDTEDDTSVHPYSLVGPAIPILNPKSSQKIMSILSKSQNNTKLQGSHNSQMLNENFAEFIKSKTYTLETKNHDNEFEKETHLQLPKKPTNVSSKGRKQSTKSQLKFWLLGFSVGMALLIGLHFTSVNQHMNHVPYSSFSINSRLSKLEQGIVDASDVSSACQHQVSNIDLKQTQQTVSLKSKLNILEEKMNALSTNLSLDKTEYAALRDDILKFTKLVDGLQLLTEAPNDLEERLSLLSSKISQFSRASTDLQEFKDNIWQDIMQKLPQIIPVFIQNHKIHCIPEFHDYLLTLLRSLDPGSLIDWNTFVHSHEHELKRYIQEVAEEKQDWPFTKLEVEMFLKQSLAEKGPIHVARNDSRFEHEGRIRDFSVKDSTNTIILDDLLEIIGRGSVKVNYAAFSVGTRILGFLTSTGENSIEGKSLARKVFLGWYDFLNSNGLQAPQNSKFNANNILFDGGQYWQCQSNMCYFGMRLPCPIILTDVIISNPFTEKPAGLHLPDSISIFIRPKTKSQAVALSEYSKKFGNHIPASDNKYLSKYFKVMELDLDSSIPIHYLQLPLSLVNRKVSSRDLFVQIRSRQGNTGLYNIKAYGLTEFAAEKYGQQFDTLLAKLTSDEEASSSGPLSHDSYVIEDDDYVL